MQATLRSTRLLLGAYASYAAPAPPRQAGVRAVHVRGHAGMYPRPVGMGTPQATLVVAAAWQRATPLRLRGARLRCTPPQGRGWSYITASALPLDNGTPVVYETIEVAGNPCNVARFAATSEHAGKGHRILIIPGNPGIVEYYDEFGSALWSEKKGEFEVVVLGLLGHTSQRGLFPIGNLYSLQEQLDHVDSYIKEHCGDVTTLNVVAHSIGCWIAIEALRRNAERVAGMVGIFPYLTNLESEELKTNIWLLSVWPIVMFVALILDLIGRLPMGLRKIMLSPVTRDNFGMGPRAAHVTNTAFACWQSFMQMCYMAKTEVEHHTKPPDWEFLEENAERMAFVFCHKEAADIWAPIHLMEEMNKKASEIPTFVYEGDHLFGCRQPTSLAMAALVDPLINVDLSADAFTLAGSKL